ncbi:hypothetical protein FRC12_004236 [Ceratobasidium sp. 428]|nr:hypothetical protein FRC12_004236 [Ceratobasidium sp. 428]
MLKLSLKSLSLALGPVIYSAGYCKAEPPNPIYQYHMNEATAVYNMTMFIIPYPKNATEELAGYPLLPSSPTPEETAPLVLQFGKLADIRQNVAQIQELMSASFIIPNVDRLNNNKTSFSRTVYTFTDQVIQQIASRESGTLNHLQVIPSIVSSVIEGYRNEIATFTPSHDAYGVNQDVFSYQVKQTVVPPLPNPVSGPGVSVPIFDAWFKPLPRSEDPTYSQGFYESLVNGPIFGYGPKCGTITTFFNYTFTWPQFVLGNVTLYGSPAGDNTAIESHFPKTMEFINVPGMTATVAEIQVTATPFF